MRKHPFRFEVCLERSLCELPNCNRYPTHGILFVRGVACDKIIFSEPFALFLLERKNAGITTSDEQRIVNEIEGAGLVEDDVTQSDRAAWHLEQDELVEVLDIIHGITPSPMPARFEKSAASELHRFLYAFGDRRVALGFSTYHDGVCLIMRACERGLISEADRTRLLGELRELELPLGNSRHSFYASRPTPSLEYADVLASDFPLKKCAS